MSLKFFKKVIIFFVFPLNVLKLLISEAFKCIFDNIINTK